MYCISIWSDYFYIYSCIIYTYECVPWISVSIAKKGYFYRLLYWHELFSKVHVRSCCQKYVLFIAGNGNDPALWCDWIDLSNLFALSYYVLYVCIMNILNRHNICVITTIKDEYSPFHQYYTTYDIWSMTVTEYRGQGVA